ncbi:hypothetical protein A0257_00475 [Hymenobacter psoromatis]|nr:hypothetical protein A0257_00475 [Hymenobacter psoromatis]
MPYLLRCRLRAVLWADDGGERAITLLLLALMLAYGAGLGYMLNHQTAGPRHFLPEMLVGLNALWLVSALLIDFFPSLRPVVRTVPEHFPVSARLNVVTAFLLDLLTLRRVLVVAVLLAALAVAPRHALVPGFSLLLVLGASMLSFNVRLLVALRRWRHPLLLAHLASLGLMLAWLAWPTAPHHQALGVGMALLPWLLGAAQLYWLGPYFSARYLPAETEAPAAQTLSRLPLVWKVYGRKTWLPLLIGQVLKALLFIITGLYLVEKGKLVTNSFFYLVLVPSVNFTYVNNNLFGFLRELTANELLRLGLTPRLPRLYLQLAGPVVLVECLGTALGLLLLFPASFWPLLWLLPLGAAAQLSVGWWGSLYQAKAVIRMVDFVNMRNNVSTLMSFCTLGVAAGLYFLPWWWARIALAAVVTASAILPLRAVWRNDGALRRRLWRGIGAW